MTFAIGALDRIDPQAKSWGFREGVRKLVGELQTPLLQECWETFPCQRGGPGRPRGIARLPAGQAMGSGGVSPGP